MRFAGKQDEERTMKTLLFILFCLKAIQEILTINVALRKRCNYCGKRNLSFILVDGNRKRAEMMEDLCESYAYVDVFLKDFYYIHHVDVYEGISYKGHLDFFKVYLFTKTGMVLCSEYPERSRKYVGRVMRVNCQTQPPVDRVRVESRYNKGFYLSEIEAQTLFQSLNALFLGCFGEFPGNKVGNVGFKMCQDLCQNATIMGLKGGNECFCHDEVDWNHLRPFYECPELCESMYNCGGPDAFSVFRVALPLPYYLGCVTVDVPTARRSDKIRDVADCLAFCENQKFAIMKGGNKCGCSDEVIWSHDGDSGHHQCDSSCQDMSQRCGGNVLSAVYGTCITRKSNSSCAQVFNCARGYSEYGFCKKDSCQREFLGRYCFKQDFDECSTNVCNASISKCENVESMFRCNCFGGYAANTKTKLCEDIDECLEYTCDDNRFTCVNVIGSFMCDCAGGYFREDEEETCEDLDECETISCNEAECVNTVGSYQCRCSPGRLYNYLGGTCEESNETESHFHFRDKFYMLFLSVCAILYFICVIILCRLMLRCDAEESLPAES